MTRRAGAVLLVVVLLIAACDGADGDGGDGGTVTLSPSTAAVACPPGAAASSITCLDVEVPKDHDEPRAGSVVVTVAVVDNADTVTDTPVVFLNGGPGGGAVHLASAFAGLPFDVIVVDPRGAGLSEPSLDCPEVDSAFAELLGLATGPAAEERYDELAAACRSRLIASGVDLSDFDTATAAADVTFLRDALGIDQWNIWGSSYGTWVALEVLRDDPTGVRSVVLDTTLPPEVDFLGSIPANAARAFAELAAACAADSGCAERFGDVKATIATAAHGLEREPVTSTARRPVSGETVDVLVDGAAFHSLLFDAMYDSSLLGRLPLLIEQAAAGDVDELVQNLVDGRDPELLVFADALYDAVVCADDLPFTDPAEVAADLEGRTASFVEAFDPHPFFEDCEAVAVAPSSDVIDEPVRSDVPALLVTGRFDPVTPPEWTYAAAASLTSSTVVEMPARGHGLAIGDPCTFEVMIEFLAEPAGAPDLSCVAAAPGVRWELS